MPDTSLHLIVGPRPALAIAALRDIGLSRPQIARYFHIDERSLRCLEVIGAWNPAHINRPAIGEFDPGQGRLQRQK